MSRPAAWCTSTLMQTPVRYTLVVNERQYAAEMRRLRVKAPLPWVSDGAGATCHTLTRDDSTCCVVAIGPTAGLTGVQIAALLVHEAVHIWQAICRQIGEHAPSSEFAAYSLQQISGQLMTRYAELRGVS